MTGLRMERDFQRLDQPFDVLVVGAGVQGVCLARVLARSGLRVALVDRGDFGAATSHNSLKIMHGGLRYIQHLDFARIRESVQAQDDWRRAAGTLIRPLAFSIPTRGIGTRSPMALAAGMMLYQYVGGGSRRSLPPPGVRLGRAFQQRFPFVESAGVNGCATWYDAQILDAGRLMTECVADAVRAGCVAVNHAEVVGLRVERGQRVAGALVRDRLQGTEIDVRAGVTVCTAGAWSAALAAMLPGAAVSPHRTEWTRNVNLVLKRSLGPDTAVGASSSKPGDGLIGGAARLYFATPWRHVSILGTAHDPFDGPPDQLSISRAEIQELVDDMAVAIPGADLRVGDVAFVHLGLNPAEAAGRGRSKRAAISDRGFAGYLEVIANKYTTAPTTATRIARKLLQELGAARQEPADVGAPLPGVELLSAGAEPPADEFAWERRVYGTRFDDLIGLVDRDQGVSLETAVFRARVMLAAQREMAVTLADALFRCSDLAEQGRLKAEHVHWALDWMGRSLGWNRMRRGSELADTARRLDRHWCGGVDSAWAQLLRDTADGHERKETGG